MKKSDHEHCPLGCEHPQPFTATPIADAAAQHGVDQREQSFCGRCWFIDRLLTVMVPCAPPFCVD